MLSRLLAPHVKGQYDFTAIPIALPSPLVAALLASTTSPLTLPSTPARAPAAPGTAWVVLELGQQINTGVGGLPGGKSTFWEAKLEIPFLHHPSTPPGTLITLKHTLLFSSPMMTFSGRNLTGLRTHTASFEVEGDHYGVGGWLEVRDVAEEGEGEGWDEETLRRVLEGWWQGERSGALATRFHLIPRIAPRQRPKIAVRLHLPSLLAKNLGETRALVEGLETKIKVDEEGWLELRAKGFAFSESTAMETRDVAAF